jgi:signal peptidase I
VHRGDIVVFSKPLEQENFSDLVKRVIGLPGETISSVDGYIDINGKTLKEPWLQPGVKTLPAPGSVPFSLAKPYKIPAGEYYVMGDNRTHSADSRYFGPIPKSLIVGRAFVRIWPLSHLGGL